MAKVHATEHEQGRTRVTAEQMAARQRDISVSEFFAKNRHLLGFDNPRKALLTTVKEAVDNALDACEEAGILPDITVVIEDLGELRQSATADGQGPSAGDPQAASGRKDRTSKRSGVGNGAAAGNGAAGAAGDTGGSRGGGSGGGGGSSNRYRVTVVDNGPGIVRKQVENIFGRLLYGSKFHRLKMSRGQQGIGISAAGMYGLITTGRPMVIHTKPKAGAAAHHIELAMNTKTNRAEVTVDDETEDFPPQRLRSIGGPSCVPAGSYPTGTSVSIELEGRYQRGRGSVDEFLELTAIANPHARVTFVAPGGAPAPGADDDGELRYEPPAPEGPARGAALAQGLDTSVRTQERGGVTLFPRGVEQLPPETKEIQPHPRGVELGILIQMLREAEQDRGGSLYQFLQEKFSRVSASAAGELCQAVGATSRTRVGDVDHAQAERLFRALQEAKLPPPPTDCLAPIGVRQLLAGMLKGVRAEFYAASSRQAAVYRGRPFQIEAAIAFGGDLPKEETARVIRFANRVPLQFQQSACSSFKAAVETNWRNYDLQQPRAALPVGPLVIMIHVASVWVPFTSESKEAVADYDEIRREMKLALMECGRKLGAYLRKRARMRRESERRDIFERYIGEVARAVHALNGVGAQRLHDALLAQAKKRTAIADLRLDEDGKRVDQDDDPGDQDGVIILDDAGGPSGGDGAAGSPAPNADATGGGEPSAPASPRAGKAPKAPKPRGQTSVSPDRLDVKPLAPDKSPKPDKHAKSPRPADDLGDLPFAAPSRAQEAALAVNAAQRTPADDPPATPSAPRRSKPRVRWDPKTGKMVPVEPAGLF